MLRIPTFLAPSRIPGAGLGLFCRERVAAGTPIWRLDPGLDLVLDRLPEDPVLREFVEIYAYMPLEGPTRWVICLDNARFINHADAPNTADAPETTTATEDLPPGTEITSDYRSFCRNPFAAWGLVSGPSEPAIAEAFATGGGASGRVPVPALAPPRA